MNIRQLAASCAVCVLWLVAPSFVSAVVVEDNNVIRPSRGECAPPWHKLSETICLRLKSDVKSWRHADMLCRFEGATLLYMNGGDEQAAIGDFLATLARYRFSYKPNVWLASDMSAQQQLDEADWLWSRSATSPSANDTCSCFRIKDKLWRQCDCSSQQHFICRKSPVTVAAAAAAAKFKQTSKSS